MPWNAPKSLTTDEVYAVVAYMLNLGDIVPDDFVLSDASMAVAQARLPNRNGMTRDHGLWDVKGKPDVANVACMRDCPAQVNVASVFPDSAKSAFGDLAQQSRAPMKTREEGVTRVVVAPASEDLAKRKGCLACHGVDQRVVGPAFREVAARYRGEEGIEARLVEKLRRGGGGAWGPMSMPPHPDLAPQDARTLVRWVLGL
jgi:cytochrome c